MSSDESTEQFMLRLRDEGIVANVDQIAPICDDGDVALLFYEVSTDDDDYAAESRAGARSLGWTGGRVEVRRMPQKIASRFADVLEAIHPADQAAIAWLRTRAEGRIFVCTQCGTLCIQFADGQFALAKGTHDDEWMS